jgi:enolase-phosphatase E1
LRELTEAPRAVLIDIEGTVGSIRFVKDVLFPYARRRLRAYVLEHADRLEVAEQLAAVAAETGVGKNLEALAAELERWSDEDRKATPLKALQGMIWASGYSSGELTAHLYEDAVRALRRWSESGLPVHVYSSGSIAAQRLYFRHTGSGDLSALLAGHFDTTTGPKQDELSYRRIADAVGIPPAQLMFLSDVAAELGAAREAGLRAVQVIRDRQPRWIGPSIQSFDELGF